MKRLLFFIGLLACANFLVAEETTAASSKTPSKTSQISLGPRISLGKIGDVVNPLEPSAITTSATAVEPGTISDSTKLPLPVLRVEGNLPAMTVASSQTERNPAPPQSKLKKVWITSMLAFAGGTTLDGVSSWHQREENPLLSSANGTFAMRGVMIKAGLAAIVLIPQLIHKPKDDKTRTIYSVVNFADAAAYTAVALHNYSLH